MAQRRPSIREACWIAWLGRSPSSRFYDLIRRSLEDLFDDYSWFSAPEWNIRAHRHEVIESGQYAADFLERTGIFQNRRVIGNVPKLQKTVHVARQYGRYFQDHPESSALDFVTDGISEEDVWRVHDRLLQLGYRADLTALNFMMDVGFQVIKPDVVVSRLFLDWGWLRHAAPELPFDLTRDDLIGRGVYGTTYLYTNPRIYVPIIELAREIVRDIDRNELCNDIGWCTKNMLREFDLFVVKAGQIPEDSFGIERRLYD